MPTGQFGPIVDLDYMTKGFVQFQMGKNGRLDLLRLSSEDGQVYEFRRLVPAAAHAAITGDFAGLVDIAGGRKMYLECRGKGSPTVVLVGASRVLPRIGALPINPRRRCFLRWPSSPGSVPTTVPELRSVRSRAGSDPVLQPTMAGDAVADLHALLSAAAEVGPFVFVGHSYGGLVARLYPSTYPEDVCGLVLVDALGEGLRDAETPKQWAIQRKLLEGEIRESLVLYPALKGSTWIAALTRSAPLRHCPLFVLSADRPWGPQFPSSIAEGKLPADLPPDFGYVTDAAQKHPLFNR